MDKGPVLAPSLVEEFVRTAHSDIERVKELLTLEPALINASWDWGGGDWETALGSASHMGRSDIARLLLVHGAHMSIYCAAMLGMLAVVRAIVEADPAAASKPGPHGISLPRHATMGGDDAHAVLKYLQSL
ncbi:MAG: hypothetical protein Q7J80_00595, partial [Anaerolineales bacterium]|nr:hypothetical protein [Anaerolineales bacterium]